jgi:hypothetical protein
MPMLPAVDTDRTLPDESLWMLKTPPVGYRTQRGLVPFRSLNATPEIPPCTSIGSPDEPTDPPNTAEPFTDSLLPGLVVPMPTLPVLRTLMNSVPFAIVAMRSVPDPETNL